MSRTGLPEPQTMRLHGMYHHPTINPQQRPPTPMGDALAKPCFLAPSPATTPHLSEGLHPCSGSRAHTNSHMDLHKGMTGVTTVMLYLSSSQVCERTLMRQDGALPGIPRGKPELSSQLRLASLCYQTAVKTRMIYLCLAARACVP